jgi:uncharacterized protein YeaO (DUF488 family)
MSAQSGATKKPPPDTAMIRVKRVYDEPTPEDGTRVLIDRLWPRGLTKDNADLDEWCKQIAPSTSLRRWYDHQPARYEEFTDRYLLELETPAQQALAAHLRELAAAGPLTLLTATKDLNLSHAPLLADILRRGYTPPISPT